MLRLADGVTAEAARAALAAEALSWRDRYPRNPYAAWGHRLSCVPFVAFDAGQLRPVLLVLLGAVLLLLLVACANAACLQLVRATARARELSVRASLGATRGRMARQLLVEKAVIAVLGDAAGLLVGWVTMRVLVRLAPAEQLALKELTLSRPVLAATLAAVALTAALSGTLPAVRASRVDLRGALHEETRGGTGGRAQHRLLGAVVATQVALSLLLLLGSGLMLRSLARLLEVDPGLRAERVVTGTAALPFARYGPVTAAITFYDQALDWLRATPGVSAASVVSQMPLAGGGPPNSSPVTIAGRDTAGRGAPAHANMIGVGADYFRALGIPLQRGRTFGPADDQRPVPGPGAVSVTFSVLVDEQFARQYFPGEDPIGRRISQGPPATIVGVVGAVRQEALSAPVKATVYYNYRQWWTKDYTFVVRSTLPDAAVALVLAAVGIYGVLSYAVAQRARELGIRAALGAGPGDVTRLILWSGGRLAALGGAIGTLAFVAVGRVLASQVYGVGPRDPLTLAAALLAAVALAACWLPARRAARAEQGRIRATLPGELSRPVPPHTPPAPAPAACRGK